MSFSTAARIAAFAWIAIGLLGCESSSRLDGRGWNVLLITLDTTRADALGAYGQPLPITPHMDGLAERGVLFEQHVAAAPHTLASHASILTGRHPLGHGVRGNLGYVLAPANHTLAEALAEADYATGAEIATTVLRRRTRIAQGFASIGDTDTPGVRFDNDEGVGAHRNDLVRGGPDITRGGLAFLREHAEQRFFLWLHYFDPHSPYTPPADLARRFPNDRYLAEVAGVDAEIGRILAELETQGIAGRTLVVLTADHGEGRGDHGEPTHSYFVYDSTMRVPLILSGPPTLPAGLRVSAVTRSVDLAPTVVDLLGLPPLPEADGHSLRALLTGEDESVERVAYGESLDLYHVLGTTPLRLVRRGRWKYIHKTEPELYDLDQDPGELDDRAAREPEIVASLRGALDEIVSTTPRVMPADARTQVDAATAAQLEALGYSVPVSEARLPDEATLLEPIGSDPAAHAADLARIADVEGDLAAQRYERARTRAEGLRERHPQSAHVARMLGEACFGLGRYDDALAAFEDAVARDPAHDGYLRGLVRVLEKTGRVRDALDRLHEFAARHPCSRVRGQLARRLHALGRDAEQVRVLADGIAACPDDAGLLNDYAWLLATSPADSLRDGRRAVAMAERAIAALGSGAGANEYDTLAAAHAEAGDFDAAAATQRRVIDALEQRAAPEGTIGTYRRRLARYEARRSLRGE